MSSGCGVTDDGESPPIQTAISDTEHRATTAPVVEVLANPSPAVEPTTVVSSVFPSGNRFPENQLRLYIDFSAPMSNVDGLEEHLRLLDNRGEAVDEPFLPLGEKFWDHDYRRYSVFFDPRQVKQVIRSNEKLGQLLTAGNSYTLIIAPRGWRDANGLPLREEFRKEFVIGPADTTPLDPASWHLRIPAVETNQRLAVSFPEPLDHGLLLRGLAVESADGSRIDGDVEVTNWETRWTFTPAQRWAAGSYTLAALSILEDLAGNRIGVPFEIDAFDPIDERKDAETYRVQFEIR